MLTFKEVAATLDTLAQTQPPEIAEALQIAVELCRKRAAREDALEWAPKKGDPIWYVDFDVREIEEGKVFSVDFKGGRIDSFSVEFEEGDFDEFVGEALGDCFFKSREDAEAALQCGY